MAKISVKCSISPALVFFAILSLLSYGGKTSAATRDFGKYRGHEDMVYIPEGKFIMGSNSKEIEKVIKKYGKRAEFINYDFKRETPRRTLFLKAFYIDRYEVTNTQYKTFVDSTGHRPPRYWWNNDYLSKKDNFPVIMISWYDANAYCLWKGKRLPTEEEWEKAARGKDGQAYPWGKIFDPSKVRTAEAILTTHLTPIELSNFGAPVNEFKGDRSPYGVYDTAGNVMEWTKSWYIKNKKRVVKGAAWVHLGPRARSATKVGIAPDYVSHLIGFRCAMDAK